MSNGARRDAPPENCVSHHGSRGLAYGDLWPMAVRERQLRRAREVHLGRRPVAPAWNRRTAAVAEGLHCGPDAIDAIREQIADQEIRDRPAQLRILANERAEAESSIELANEASHAIDPLVEARAPLAQLCGARIPTRQSIRNGLGRHLSRAQGQEDSGRVERIEKAEGVTDEDPSVACNRGRAVGVVPRRKVSGYALRAADARFDGIAALDLLLIRLLMSVAHLGWIEQVVERGHDADAHDVVVLRDVPEPAAPIAGLYHHRRAFVPPGVPIGALPIGPDGALVRS